jgi:hypothetical protein
MPNGRRHICHIVAGDLESHAGNSLPADCRLRRVFGQYLRGSVANHSVHAHPRLTSVVPMKTTSSKAGCWELAKVNKSSFIRRLEAGGCNHCSRRHLRAAIWRNEGKKNGGAYFAVSIERIYRDDEDEFRTSHSFGRDDLLLLAKVADRKDKPAAKETSEFAPPSEPELA